MSPAITWYGHSSFKIVSQGQVIYIDPWKLPPDSTKADLVFISHEHFDHCSVDDFTAVAKPTTEIITPVICSDKFPTGHVHIVKPGDRLTVAGNAIEAVPAYNIGKDFHPKEDLRVGYILTLDGQRLYHAGDTDLIPEMGDIHCDIALLPVSGTYVMTAEEAAEAVKLIKPKVVIPMHYGSIVGSMEDVEKFKTLVPPEVEVRVLKKATT